MLAKIKPTLLWLEQQASRLSLTVQKISGKGNTGEPQEQDRQWPYSVAIALVTVGLVWGAESRGFLRIPELAIYDGMVQLRGTSPPDSRLLIVGIDDDDIRRQERWPITDGTLAQALDNLQRHDPRVIGLDIYRDLKYDPGHTQFVRQLNQPNVVTIRDITGQKPPIGYGERPPIDQVGFNDVVLDPDGVVRRNLLLASTPEGQTLFSFSMQLAKQYYAPRQIRPKNNVTNPNWMDFGKTTFFPINATAGAYRKEAKDARGYQVLLDYRRHDPVAPELSLSQVLAGEFDPALVQGKIVLIGSVADSLRDVFFTPHSATHSDRPKIPGVYVHAQALLQIMDAVDGRQPLPSYWQDWQETLWLILWVSIGCGIAHSSKHPLLSVVLICLSSGVLAIFTFQLFLQAAVWIPSFAPTAGLWIGAVGTMVFQVQQARRQRQAMLTLLGQNTSPDIAQALWQNRGKLLKAGRLPGRQLTATILFSDIRNFTPVAEQLSPAELLEWLNEYLGLVSEAVRQHKGTVNKFMGDGMMALFGVPVPRTNAAEVGQDAQNAVDCALAVREGLGQLSQRMEDRGWPPIHVRIGIYTGPVVVGSVGGQQRWEYGAVGASVNVASRLESCVRDRQPGICRILLARETLVHLDNRFLVEAWGPLPLKGLQEPVEVYYVLRRATGGQSSVVEPVSATPPVPSP